MPAALHAADAPPLPFHSAVDVCAFVDGLAPDATGELLFAGADPSSDGSVFVERGRVCWAAARGLARRLSRLLAASAKVDDGAMEALYAACKKQRAPLGEFLVNAGWITAGDLRAALLKHTAESLHALCGTEARAAWIARRPGGYCSQFTFATTELLTRTFAEAHAALVERAEAELAWAFDDGDWGAAYVRSAARAAPDPIAVRGASPDRVEALLRLGRWAASSLDVTSVLHDEHALVAMVIGDGALVAWRAGPTIVAGRTGPCGPARLLNRRARARRGEASHGGL